MVSTETVMHPIDFNRTFCRLGHAHAKIVATIGPASEDLVSELVEAGMSVARINFGHGDHDDHRRRVAKVRAVAEAKGVPIGILADIRGPKLRMGKFSGPMTVEEGQRVPLREGKGPFEEGVIPINVPGVVGKLEPGQRVFLADGAVELVVEGNGGQACEAVVRRSGVLNSGKGVHLPDTPLDMVVPTEQDELDLVLAKELEVDFIGVSFVARASELERIRELIPGTLLVAKIERAAALENIEELIGACDGLMVARGDLGVEVEMEAVPMVQKSLIQMALRAGKFTITATEMLESMIVSSRPTRAEVTDVANAVLDGSDAVMLSAETAVGEHAVEAVATMDRIASSVEASQYYQDLPKVSFRASEPTFSNAASLAAAKVADALDMEKIIAFTQTGNTVRLLSRYRAHAEIIALSPEPRTLSQMTILAHVRPIACAQATNLDEMLERASSDLMERGLVQEGEQVVFVAGVPPGVARSTNVLKLHCIGDPITLA